MTLFWPILWLGGMLAAVVAFLTAILIESGKKKKALKAAQARNAAVAAQADVTPDFPSENLDFPDESFS